MKKTSKLIQTGLFFLFTCVLMGGCGNSHHEVNQKLIKEVEQQQTARRRSMELYKNAITEYEANNVQAAYEFLRQSVEINSRNASAWVALGILEYEKDNLFEAADAFGRALRLEPRRFEPRYNMGLIYETAGKYSQAIAAYEKALKIAPDERAVMENLIRCYIKTDYQREEILQLIDRALLLEQKPQWREWLEKQKTRLM